MARLREILAAIDFPEHERPNVVLSDDTKVRLNPASQALMLKADADGAYPTDNDLWARSPLFYPTKGREWRGFYVQAVEPTGTSLGFKLYNGTDDYYWDGGAWVVAGASDWSTEAEIASNIATYPHRKLAVVANLKTTDPTVTPVVAGYLVGYGARIVFLEQWIYRTLVPLLRNNVRPDAAWPIPIGTATTTIDLNNYELDTPFNIIDMVEVFNHTDDPDHETDLLSSYDPGTKIITLTTTIDAGKVAWIVFEYGPEVAALTSVDYTELQKLPALTIENLRVGKSIRHGHDNPLLNKGDHAQARKYEPPWQCALLGDIKVHAPRSVDELALVEEVIAYISENQSVKIPATDEYVDWIVTDYYTRDTLASEADLRTSSIAFEMRWLKAWLRPVRTAADGVYMVTGMKLTGSVDVVI